jgi:uncharacterized membrane protein
VFAIIGLIEAFFALITAAELATEVGKDNTGKRSWKRAGFHLICAAIFLVGAGGFAYAIRYHWNDVTNSLMWLVYGLGAFAGFMLLWIAGIIIHKRSSMPKIDRHPGKGR